jgi:hypothetical protein
MTLIDIDSADSKDLSETLYEFISKGERADRTDEATDAFTNGIAWGMLALLSEVHKIRVAIEKLADQRPESGH